MKKKLIICLLPLLALSACSDWLDVEPKSEIKLDIMFETEQGFKDALTGCYMLLSDDQLYGATLTCTFLDVLGQQYAFLGSTSSPYYNASRYIYSSYESIISGIWSKMYNAIANINALIEGLEANQSVLHPSIYAMTKAEAYSLRAFVYLDLVRLFTWGNLPERSDKLEMLSIPYVKVYDKYIIPQETLGKVLQYIHDDLEVAIALFNVYDPDSNVGDRPEGYELPNDDLFYDKTVRPYRMSLKAALATRMRLNMWEGNYENALTDAQMLIDDFSPTWNNTLDNNENLRDLAFSTEMLFGVETFERFENTVKTYFKLTVADDLNMNYSAFYLPESRVNEIYEVNGGIGSADWRYARLWEKASGNYCFLKFWEYEDMQYTNKMPLLKWPEIYYTAAECLIRKGGAENREKAIDYLNTVRHNRNIPSTNDLPYTLSIDEVNNEIYKEWCKEYIGDGQMFYYYKRLGYTSIPNGPAVDYNDQVYVLPMPQTEVDFGGRVELVED